MLSNAHAKETRTIHVLHVRGSSAQMAWLYTCGCEQGVDAQPLTQTPRVPFRRHCARASVICCLNVNGSRIAKSPLKITLTPPNRSGPFEAESTVFVGDPTVALVAMAPHATRRAHLESEAACS